MLDTNARKYVQPLLDRIAKACHETGIGANALTIAGMVLVLAGVIAMSLLLSIGAAVANRSAKSFHYAPGLGERTEAFICLTLMILDSERLVPWTWVFVAVIVFTMGQRLRHAQALLAEGHLHDQA